MREELNVLTTLAILTILIVSTCLNLFKLVFVS